MIAWWWALPFAITAAAALYCSWHLVLLARVCAEETRRVLARTDAAEREPSYIDEAPDAAPQAEPTAVTMARIAPERILQARAALHRLGELSPPPSGALACAQPGCIAWINPRWLNGSGWTQAIDGSWRCCSAHMPRELGGEPEEGAS